jgi:hypothetical protein
MIAMKKPPKKRSPRLVPAPLIAGSPVIGTPALGHVYNLGPPPHDLVAVDLEVSSPDIAPQFKPRTSPAAQEVPTPAKKKRKQPVRRQGVILDGLLQTLDREGVVSGRATSDIHRRVKKRWPVDSKIKCPDYTTVARHLKRRED